jgi:hypothetical protein
MNHQSISKAPPFAHPNDIRIGAGRVVYASATRTRGQDIDEGYVLPGGIRTPDRQQAVYVAAEIDRIACRNRPTVTTPA